MDFDKKFNKLSRLVQVILLLIPVVNWITEVLVRVSAATHGKSMGQLIVLVICILPTGIVIGWVDLIWTLLFKHLILA